MTLLQFFGVFAASFALASASMAENCPQGESCVRFCCSDQSFGNLDLLENEMKDLNPYFKRISGKPDCSKYTADDGQWKFSNVNLAEICRNSYWREFFYRTDQWLSNLMMKLATRFLITCTACTTTVLSWCTFAFLVKVGRTLKKNCKHLILTVSNFDAWSIERWKRAWRMKNGEIEILFQSCCYRFRFCWRLSWSMLGSKSFKTSTENVWWAT